MDVFQVTAEVPALSESFLALRTGEWSLPGVLPEVVSQVAAFFEN
jgi:hypothetical protein